MEFQQLVAWIGLLVGSGALVTIGKVLLDVGSWRRETEAHDRLLIDHEQRMLTSERDMTAYKISMAREAVDRSALIELERKFSAAVDGMRSEMREGMHLVREDVQRMIRVLEYRRPAEAQ